MVKHWLLQLGWRRSDENSWTGKVLSRKGQLGESFSIHLAPTPLGSERCLRAQTGRAYGRSIAC